MASTSSEKEAREDHTLEMREEAKEMRMERQLAEKTVRRTSNMKTHSKNIFKSVSMEYHQSFELELVDYIELEAAAKLELSLLPF